MTGLPPTHSRTEQSEGKTEEDFVWEERRKEERKRRHENRRGQRRGGERRNVEGGTLIDRAERNSSTSSAIYQTWEPTQQLLSLSLLLTVLTSPPPSLLLSWPSLFSRYYTFAPLPSRYPHLYIQISTDMWKNPVCDPICETKQAEFQYFDDFVAVLWSSVCIHRSTEDLHKYRLLQTKQIPRIKCWCGTLELNKIILHSFFVSKLFLSSIFNFFKYSWTKK